MSAVDVRLEGIAYGHMVAIFSLVQVLILQMRKQRLGEMTGPYQGLHILGKSEN